MPTTLNGGVALTQLVGGNSALALALTVSSVLLGILTVPLWITKYVVGEFGLTIPIWPLFQSLVIRLIVPLILGKGLKSLETMECRHQGKKMLGVRSVLISCEFKLLDDDALLVKVVSPSEIDDIKEDLFGGRFYDHLAYGFVSVFLQPKELVPVGWEIDEVYSSRRLDYDDMYHYHIYFGISPDSSDSNKEDSDSNNQDWDSKNLYHNFFVQLEVPKNEFPEFRVNIISFLLDPITNDFKRGCPICPKWVPHPLDLGSLRVPKGRIGYSWPRQIYTSGNMRSFLPRREIPVNRLYQLKSFVGPKTLKQTELEEDLD